MNRSHRDLFKNATLDPRGQIRKIWKFWKSDCFGQNSKGSTLWTSISNYLGTEDLQKPIQYPIKWEYPVNTDAKLTHLFADFQRFLAKSMVEIIDFGALRTHFAQNRPRKRLENRKKEVKPRKIVIKPIETQNYPWFL